MESTLAALRSILPREYSPNTAAWVSTFGEDPVLSLTIRRAPLPRAMEAALSSVSARPWDVIKAEEGIDSLMHLAILLTTHRGLSQLEKNVGLGLTFQVLIDYPEGAEYLSIPLSFRRDTVNNMLNRTQTMMGPDRYFLYDAFDANCQDWVWSFLTANGLDTPSVEKFVKQPTQRLVYKAFSPPLQSAMMAYTDARTLFGQGGSGVHVDK
jgi:hypothetical protein